MKGKSRHKHKGSSLRIFSVYYFLLRFYYPEPPSSAGRNSWNSISYVAMLEPVSDPTRLAGQDGGLLVQAYQMAGEPEKARGYIQTREYLDLLNLVSDAMISLALYQDDFKRCQKTIYRIGNVIEQYRLEQLHPNVAAQFHYQTAVVYALNGAEEGALKSLRSFQKCVDRLLCAEKMTLHGDDIVNIPLHFFFTKFLSYLPQ